MKIAIQSDPIRGLDIIKLLESFGGDKLPMER